MSHSSHNERRNQKREQFSQPGRPGLRPNHIIGAALVVFVILVAFIALGSSTKSNAAVVTPSADGRVRIPLADVSDGRARFFEYRGNSKAVRFFVIRSSDGVYRAAADACDVCYRAKKGYYQQGDDMVCKKCGQRFPSKYVNVVRGGCNPAGVPGTVEGDQFVLLANELESQAYFF